MQLYYDDNELLIDKKARVLFIVFCCAAAAEWLGRTFYYTRFALYTYVTLALVLIGVGCIIWLRSKSKDETVSYEKLLYILIGWNIITIIRGAFYAQSYWDWKMLLFSNTPSLLIPVVALIGNNVDSIGKFFIKIFPWYFIIAFLSIAPLNAPQIVYLWTPLYFFILCTPYYSNKKCWLIILLAVFLISIDFSARSNLIRVTLALLLCFSWRYIVSHERLVASAQRVLFILPFILIFLGVTGVFNIFDIQSYAGDGIAVSGANGEELDFTTDTRTFIYEEQFSSMYKHHSFLFGEGGCGKYITTRFGTRELGAFRGSSEVGALNTLLYSGIIGLLIYGLVFYKASRLALTDSNNVLVKLMGLFIILRWDYFFVEEFTEFNTNFFMLWLMIGLCLSPVFRHMTDDDIWNWLHGEPTTYNCELSDLADE